MAASLGIGTAAATLDPGLASANDPSANDSPATLVDNPLLHSPPSAWDVTAARGKRRTIEFTTTEGTWISLDVAPDGKALVFDLLGSIYSLPVEGGEAKLLTASSGVALNYQPAFSPSGREIAFVSDRSGQDSLWVMDSDGRNARQIFFDPLSRIAAPRWMPDGKAIVAMRRLATFWGFYRTNDTLWIFPLDGGQPRRLTREDPQILPPSEYSGMVRWQSPAPSADGRFIYFSSASFIGGDRRIRRANLQFDRIEDVSEDPAAHEPAGETPAPLLLGDAAPAPSPDGRFLAFVRKLPGASLDVDGNRLKGRTALWVRDLGTGAERLIMDPVEADQMLELPQWKASAFPSYAWTPDSREIFIAQGGHIRRLNVASGAVTTVPFRARVSRVVSEQARARGGAISTDTFAPHYVRTVVASPADPGRLAFELAGRIWVKLTSAGAARPLNRDVPTDALERSPTWSPDGTHLAYVTSDGYDQGALWTARADGRAVRVLRLSPSTGRYAAPFWSPDGRWIYVNRWPPALTRTAGKNGRYWELWRFSSDAAGRGELVAGNGDRIDVGFHNDGRIYFTRSSTIEGSGSALPATALMSMTSDGTDVRQQLLVVGRADRVVPSPGSAHVAIQQFQEIWVAPIKSETPIDLLRPNASGIERISTRGGVAPFWVDDRTLLYGSAGAYSLDAIDNPKNELRSTGVKLVRNKAKGSLAFVDARLVTLGPQRTIERGSIVVRDGRIACVGQCTVSNVEKVIDARGKTIIPGLVDVHSHSTRDDTDFLPVKRAPSGISLAYGVTTVHDPSTYPDPSIELGDLIEAGRIVGPRTFSTGISEMSTGRGWERVPPILRIEDARSEVERARNHGVRSLKDYKLATRAQRQMLVEAAREQGLTVTGEGAEFPYELGRIMDGAAGWEHPMGLYPTYGDLIQFLAQAGAHYSNQFENVGFPNSGISVDYFLSRTDVWNASKLRTWMSWRDMAARQNVGQKPLETYAFPVVARDNGRLMRLGGFVPLGSHSLVEGLGMHWEIWALALATDPEMALRAASQHGAHFLGLEDQLGSLEAGKVADMVVLDANPLEDIHNSLHIRWVMKAGVLRDAETLDALWPERIPYGTKPWQTDDIFRSDVRPVDYWDVRPH